MSNVLDVRDLWVRFDTPQGPVIANRSVNMSIGQNEALGLMGESGCGKSVLGLALLGLQRPGVVARGSIILEGTDLTGLRESQRHRLRGRRIALVPQDHGTALNPLHTVGMHLAEAIAVRDGVRGIWGHLTFSLRGRTARDEAVWAMETLGLHPAGPLLQAYQHQLSGGMRQRVLIALALLQRPRLIVCDEPTTALDHRTKQGVIESLARLRQECSLLVISHDQAVLRSLSDRIAVMYAGSIVEVGPASSVLTDPCHPYTLGLLAAQRFRRGERLAPIPGDQVDLAAIPSGCAFHPRCPWASDPCREVIPLARQVAERQVACHLFASR